MTDRNYRDAGTGEFVSRETADADPDGTVSEPRTGTTLPTVGRVVHYVSYGTPGGEFPQTCRAAIITEVETDTVVSLAVLNPTGMFFNTGLTHDDGDHPAGGTWHWPERV